MRCTCRSALGDLATKDLAVLPVLEKTLAVLRAMEDAGKRR
jgi:hypothetical protein